MNNYIKPEVTLSMCLRRKRRLVGLSCYTSYHNVILFLSFLFSKKVHIISKYTECRFHSICIVGMS